jgi:pyruvate formate lyase activating enzyme
MAPRETRLELCVGGLTPLTTIDFPGRLAAVVFCQGCPCRCGYCHNPHLWAAGAETEKSWQDVLNFLARRRGLLDGVVFSGGEPTLQSALPGAMGQVRELGFQLGLHTAGVYPARLAAVLPLLDWVGLDIKAPFQCYETVTCVPGSGERVRRSLDLVLRSGVDYECRTTWHPGLFPESDLSALGEALTARGVTCWTVQVCRIASLATSLGADTISRTVQRGSLDEAKRNPRNPWNPR